MASEESLVVFVHQILNDKETSNVVDKSILLSRVELNSIGILSIVANGVIHLNHLLLTFLLSWLLHCSNVSWSFVSFLCSKDAGLQVLLSVHYYSLAAIKFSNPL